MNACRGTCTDRVNSVDAAPLALQVLRAQSHAAASLTGFLTLSRQRSYLSSRVLKCRKSGPGSRLSIVLRSRASEDRADGRQLTGAACCEHAASMAREWHALEDTTSALLSQDLGCSNGQKVALQPQHPPCAHDQRHHALRCNLWSVRRQGRERRTRMRSRAGEVPCTSKGEYVNGCCTAFR